MSSTITDTENGLLENAASDFGSSKNFGQDPSLNGMDSFTISATFELDTLSGGTQALVWNTQQYGLILHNDTLYVYLRGTDGRMDVFPVADAFDSTGWHDVQVVVDDQSGTLDIWVDGENSYSGSSENIQLGGTQYSGVTAGVTPWGHQLQGQIADVSITDEALEIDGSQSIYERMYAMDEGDNASTLEAAPTDPDGPAENTAAEVSGTDTGSVTEDASLTTSGKLTVSDADAGESSFQAGTQTGAHGTLS
ncbi:LamG-like jellyroll fold domain-containing protein, partial [Sneathiella sp.]|uniref:LamG-like jellyroll fold domain-containing protein n=1 Tax=Sneathiella sp. TaxID=1964365 RepID=UPI0039E57B97